MVLCLCMKKFDVIIIGGGASGIASAIRFAEKGKSVCILEKANKIGKKILQTGNGRCNLSNDNVNIFAYNETEMVKEIFNVVSKEKVLEFYKNLGIETFSDEEGRIYPLSETASSVVDAMSLKLNDLGVSVFCEQEIVKLEKKNCFEIETTEDRFVADKVVVSCGVLGLKSLIKSNFRKDKKILVGLKCENYEKILSGIRQNAEVRIDSLNFKEKGQVQFKDNGISGIVVFNASFEIAKSKFPVDVNLDLLPSKSKQEISKMLEYKKKISYLKIEDVLMGIFPYNLCKVILKRARVNIEKNIKELSNGNIQEIVEVIKNFKVKVVETLGEPQVLAGGMRKEDLKKLECKDIPNLFVAGEASGVFGKCGGYNLHYAVASGLYLAEVE